MANALPGLIGEDGPLMMGSPACTPLGANVAALAIGILQKSDVSGSVGVVLQALDYGRDTVLAALPIDNSIVLFVAPRDAVWYAAAVSDRRIFLRADQGFMRRPFVQLRIYDLDDETAPAEVGFAFTTAMP